MSRCTKSFEMLHYNFRMARHIFPPAAILILAACNDSSRPSAIRDASARIGPALSQKDVSPGDPNSGAGDTKAFIGAWLDGKRVELRYSRSYYCAEPPTSIATSDCEIGAPPEDFPRGGNIPMIYALAPVGFTPSDPSTIHCQGCANHPMQIDITRLNLPISLANSPPHSHIITSSQAGWHRTVNIRVLSSTIWNQIAASPNLETVRQLQAANPTLISHDLPTNIFFFFQVHAEGHPSVP